MLHITTSRLTRLIAVSLTATAVAAPAAQARPADVPAPAAPVVEAPAPRTDVRSPDARDVAERGPVSRPVPTVVVTRPSGFEWDDAAIGAAGSLGIALLLGGLVVTARMRRTHARMA